VVELDLGHLEAAAPLGLVPQAILKCAARVRLGDEELYRFRVVKLGERVQTHAQSLTRCEEETAGAPLTGFLQVAANMVPMFV
jgi:hypothetical protein